MTYLKQLFVRHKAKIIIFLSAFILITLFSNLSPIYKFCDMPDPFTWLAQSSQILEGKILYKDIYEHKGPLQLIPYVIASLTPEPLYGMWVVQVVLFYTYMYYCYKIADLYNKKYSVLIAMLTGFLTAYNTCFHNSGTTEELFLFVLPASLYPILRAIKKDRMLTKRESFIIGLLQAMLLWSKYTLCSFTIGLCLFMIYWHYKKKESILPQIIYFLYGVFAITFLIFIYFIANGAIKDLFEVYFYNTIVIYPQQQSAVPIQNKIVGIAWYYAPMFICMLFGAVLGRKRIGLKRLDVMCVTIVGIVLFGILFSLNCIWPYYFLQGIFYSLFGFIALFSYDKKYLTFICAGLVLFTALSTQNTMLEKISANKEDYGQFEIFDYIKDSGDHKIICLTSNVGFYYYTDSTPFNKYFTYYSIELDEINKEIKEIIDQGKTDFIVDYKESDYENYELVMKKDIPTFDVGINKLKNGNTTSLYLYQKK